MILGANGIPNTVDLPATMVVEDGVFQFVVSYWKPTPEELELLNSNGHVVLMVHSGQHPPVNVEVSQ